MYSCTARYQTTRNDNKLVVVKKEKRQHRHLHIIPSTLQISSLLKDRYDPHLHDITTPVLSRPASTFRPTANGTRHVRRNGARGPGFNPHRGLWLRVTWPWSRITNLAICSIGRGRNGWSKEIRHWCLHPSAPYTQLFSIFCLHICRKTIRPPFHHQRGYSFLLLIATV